MKYIVIAFLMISFGCQGTIVEEEAKAKETRESNELSTDSSLLATFFDEATIAQINTIKKEYETGIKDGFSFDKIGGAYEYNSTTLRTDLFNEIPYTLTFPYNGKFELTKYEKGLQNIDFFTKKCGFEDPKTSEIFHYWCLSLDKNFFSYLDELGKESPFIKMFAEDYQKSKSISSEMKRQLMLLQSAEIDFYNYDHQVVYMLIHVLINEERIAYDKVK